MSNEKDQSMPKFSPGDVVQLISGGPLMTIKNPRPNDAPSRLWTCIWFSGDEVKEQQLPEATLKKIVSH